MAESTLIIFVKNPIPGTVKTRIARTVGNERAVAVYQHLLRHTQAITQQLRCHRVVYYGDFINEDDGWNGCEKRLQVDGNLGQRMQESFREQFEHGADRVAIIGSDCLSITARHIETAFASLDEADVVIGPATDGGYYLLAMKKLHPALFDGMPWSQPDLRQQTERAIRVNGLTVCQLDELTDIDEWADYENALK